MQTMVRERAEAEQLERQAANHEARIAIESPTASNMQELQEEFQAARRRETTLTGRAESESQSVQSWRRQLCIRCFSHREEKERTEGHKRRVPESKSVVRRRMGVVDLKANTPVSVLPVCTIRPLCGNNWDRGSGSPGPQCAPIACIEARGGGRWTPR